MHMLLLQRFAATDVKLEACNSPAALLLTTAFSAHLGLIGLVGLHLQPAAAVCRCTSGGFELHWTVQAAETEHTRATWQNRHENAGSACSHASVCGSVRMQHFSWAAHKPVTGRPNSTTAHNFWHHRNNCARFIHDELAKAEAFLPVFALQRTAWMRPGTR
jgi:hypothetical protein